jgi:hypothetical protein
MTLTSRATPAGCDHDSEDLAGVAVRCNLAVQDAQPLDYTNSPRVSMPTARAQTMQWGLHSSL